MMQHTRSTTSVRLQSWLIVAIFVLHGARAADQVIQSYFMDQEECQGQMVRDSASPSAPRIIDTFALVYSHAAAGGQRNASFGNWKRLVATTAGITGDYPARIDCQLHFLAAVHWRIMFRFEYIDIACENDDALYVFDGPSAYAEPWDELGGQRGLCGSMASNRAVLSRRFNTTDIHLTLAFKTNSRSGSRKSGKGFRMMVTAVTDCPRTNDAGLPALVGGPSWTIFRDAGLFRCANGLCLRLSMHCDGVDQCGDRSDEFNCEFPVGDSSQGSRLRTESADRCPSAEPKLHQVELSGRGLLVQEYADGLFLWRCHNGLCINATQLCDGVSNCADDSDELSCPEEDEESSTPSRAADSDNAMAKFLKLGVAATLAIACGTIIVLGAVIGTTVCLCMKRYKHNLAEGSETGVQPGSKGFHSPIHQCRMQTVYPSGGSLSGTDVTQQTSSSTQHTGTNSNGHPNGTPQSPYLGALPFRGNPQPLLNWTNESGLNTATSPGYVIAPGLIYQPAQGSSNSTSSSRTATHASAPSAVGVGVMPLLTKRRSRHGSWKQFKLRHLDLPITRRSNNSVRSKTSSSSNERTPTTSDDVPFPTALGDAHPRFANHSTRQLLSPNVPLMSPEAQWLTQDAGTRQNTSPDAISENDEDRSSGVSLALSERTKTTVIHQGVRQHPELLVRPTADFPDRRRLGATECNPYVLPVPLPPAPMAADLLITSSTNENLSLTMRLSRNLDLQHVGNAL